MQNKLLKDFETFRGSLIAAIFDYVQKAENQTVFLENSADYRISGDECIIKQVYRKLFIQNGFLFIEYDSSDNFCSRGCERITEELDILSANEIYEIIRRMKK